MAQFKFVNETAMAAFKEAWRNTAHLRHGIKSCANQIMAKHGGEDECFVMNEPDGNFYFWYENPKRKGIRFDHGALEWNPDRKEYAIA